MRQVLLILRLRLLVANVLVSGHCSTLLYFTLLYIILTRTDFVRQNAYMCVKTTVE